MSADLTIKQPALGNDLTFKQAPFQGKSFESPLYYGFRGGYFFSRHIGLDAEFIHMKVFADVNRTADVSGTLRGAPFAARIPIDTIVQRFSISHGLNEIMGNLVIRESLLERGGGLGRLLLTARVGVGSTVPHVESTIGGAADEHYQGGSPVLQFGGGAEFRLFHGLYVLGEYKFTRTHQHVDIVSGTAEVLIRAQHLVGGLAYHF